MSESLGVDASILFDSLGADAFGQLGVGAESQCIHDAEGGYSKQLSHFEVCASWGADNFFYSCHF
ncbi:hypothetical protein, partial [Lancefieldella rimae]|uniref:hypothetical protein n=1 Tax=Lancefieldella rimae TaxID=1383 RepID=UPI003A954F5F